MGNNFSNLGRFIYNSDSTYKCLECNSNIEVNEKILQDFEKQIKYDRKYLEIAKAISGLSYASRKKVGAIIVRDKVIISDGFNGTPTGFENECEDDNGDTKWYTLHAEANAILKLVKIGGISARGSTLYLTLSPCKECAKLILQSGIRRVVYKEAYRDISGINFLIQSGISTEFMPN